MKNFFLTLVLLVFVALAYLAFEGLRFVNRPAQEAKTPVLFEVLPGQSFGQVALQLAQAGLISDARKFKIYARLNGSANLVRMGEYELNTHMTPSEIMRIIISGISVKRVMVVPEGYNRYEIADIFERAGLGTRAVFLKTTENTQLIRQVLGEDLPSFEGYLFPETYYFTKYMGAEEVIRVMVQNFLKNYNELQTRAPMPLSRHQLVTLASMVEKETGAPEERPTIASVFYNRLRKTMKLQSDPTTLYGILDITKQMKKNITRVDLLTPTRYNTYTIPGIPFGPISNPGREALRAVFHPAEGEFLYFVSRNDGFHIFSKDYKGHNDAVKKFQLDPKARQGKSWRDMSKQTKPKSRH
jgi:UPF0755 protein